MANTAGQTALDDLYVVDWLEGKGDRMYSQNLEDGYINAIFERIGTTSRWCFEVGASDGIHLSNTYQLVLRGWYAVLIEADEMKYRDLCSNFQMNHKVTCFHKRIDDCDLDTIVGKYNMDFGSIDIDSDDFWVWAGLQTRPRVMCVEFASFPHNSPITDPPLVQRPGQIYQAGHDYLVRLGKAKGYTHVATTPTNALFVRDDCLV